MRAQILSQPKQPLTAAELPEPRPGPGQLLIAVKACAVCRTDLHVVEGDLPPHKLPVIPGHQVVGRVDQTGEGVARLQLGQRIGIAWLRHVDGTCSFCRAGR